MHSGGSSRRGARKNRAISLRFSSVIPFASLDRLLQSTPRDEHSLI
jgi:hypothetical protein